MKLKDRLAFDHALNDHCVEHSGGCLQDAYNAGFEKARELACAALDAADSDPTGKGWEAIRQIGESEGA